MAPIRTSLSIVGLSVATLALSACAAPGEQHDTHHPVQTAGPQLAQATPGGSGMGMGMGTPASAHSAQMKAMQEMHEKMLAARTPEERNALMAAQMTLMHKGMNMMGGMGGMSGMGAMGASGPMASGAASGQPGQAGDMATRQGMMEQHMEMMQSMMQMMMDRMPPGPAAK